MTPETIKGFLKDESGAVTVDWVVLTAGVIMLFLAVAFPILNNAIAAGSENIAGTIESANTYLTP